MSSSPFLRFRSALRWRLHPRAVPRVFAVALLVAGAAVVGAGPAAARTLGCGEVITVDTTLDGDLVDCPDIGLVIGADDITLDLNGHTIDGDAVSPESCPVEGRVCDVGVDNSAGHRGVTITGGSIQQFTAGVVVTGGDDNTLRRLTIAQTTNEAILVLRSARTLIEGNTITDPGFAVIVALESSDTVVSRNVASGNEEEGILVGGTGISVRGNVVSNGANGVDVANGSSGVRVEGNALRNVGDGVIVGVVSDTVVRHNAVNAVGGGELGGFGIILDGAVTTTVEQNSVRVSGPGPAIYVAHLDAPTAPRDDRVMQNHATSEHADGILVDPDATGTLVVGNAALRSGDDGIDVDAPGTTLTGNFAAYNHDLGIEAVPGVVDGGGNRAVGNGNPAQCTNITCS
jgi:parallel beta-helix repeat protein